MRGQRLTERQRVVLGVVGEVGPITPADLAYHVPGVSAAAARAMLARLEKRGLVDATYTDMRDGGRGYILSERGAQRLSAW